MNQLDSNGFDELLARGWTTFRGVLDSVAVESLKSSLAEAELACVSIRARRGLQDADGSAHHLPVFRGAFLEFLEQGQLDPELRKFFGGAYTLNSFGASVNRPGVRSYLHGMHRDVRSFTRDIRLMVNMLVMLDAFTLDNGATYFLSGSHQFAERPDETDFLERADRATGAAGDIVLFDSRLWHAAAPNKTDSIRRGLTLTFTPPFMKPQFDYPRALGYDHGAQFGERLREVLGYDSRIPASLEQWYQPPAHRFYRPGQG